MRIIGGIFRGKSIIGPMDGVTRPLKDLTKESIFNVINHSNKFTLNLKGSNVLDLFSGVGSFGLECLSRGAANVLFIENYAKTVDILQKNLNNLVNVENYQIVKLDILKINFLTQIKDKFDLIFMDPPYAEKNINIVIDYIKDNETLSDNGIIVLHRHRKNNDILPDYLKIVEKKTYGISQITFAQLI